MKPIVILGAGLAGLSLADALLDEDLATVIVLIDRRRAWGRDRTWCTWATEGLRFGALADRRWWEWRTCRGAAVAAHRTARFPYLHIGSQALYDVALDRLDRDPRVVVRAGEQVRAVRGTAAEPEVVTDRETFAAAHVIDALGPRSPFRMPLASGTPAFAQRFLGWEVEVESPAFDPGAVTLMDFRAPEDGALTFLYVLPFTATRALVEHTTIGPPHRAGPSAPRRRELLSAELGERMGLRGWQILHEERGEIPMDPRGHGGASPVWSVGAAAGAIRPSSGYAFSRIQRHVGLVARAIAQGTTPPSSVGTGRLAAMDRVFLAALAEEHDHGEGLLWSLAERTPADVFARFMTDASTLGDESAIVRALPPLTMGASALRLLANNIAGHALSRSPVPPWRPPAG